MNDKQFDEKRQNDAYDNKAIMASIVFAGHLQSKGKSYIPSADLEYRDEEVWKIYKNEILFATDVANLLFQNTNQVD